MTSEAPPANAPPPASVAARLQVAFSSVLVCLFRAFIAPWMDKERAQILAACLIGSFGSNLQAFILNYHFSDRGLWDIAPFQMARWAALGFIGVPIGLYLLTRARPRWGLFLVQATGLAFIWTNPLSLFHNMVGVVLAAGPFWGVYGLRFARGQSGQGRGYEMALSTLLSIMAGAGGIFTAGLLIERAAVTSGLIAGALGLVLGMQLLIRPWDAPLNLGRVWRWIGWRKPSTRMTLFSGILYTTSDVCMPIWFRVIGLSPLLAGSVLAAQPFLTLLATPLVGALLQGSSRRAGVLGGGAICLGWILLLTLHQNPYAMTAALVLLALAGNLVGGAEANRWFKRRVPEAIIAREMLLASARSATMGLALPVLFGAPALFPLMGAGISLLFLMLLRRR